MPRLLQKLSLGQVFRDGANEFTLSSPQSGRIEMPTDCAEVFHSIAYTVMSCYYCRNNSAMKKIIPALFLLSSGLLLTPQRKTTAK